MAVIALEILPVTLDAGSIRSLHPADAPSWQVDCPAGADPGPEVVAALRDRGLAPVVVHSTSWRHDDGRLLLTYLVVLAEGGAADAGLEARPLRPAVLARGGAITAPPRPGVDQVLHHALRHLAWLQREDAVVAAALDPAWEAALAHHRPGPFAELTPLLGYRALEEVEHVAQ
jgi:hypothetical protein